MRWLKFFENSNANILIDMNIKVSAGIKENKPDIIVIDKISKIIRIIEIGITSKDYLQLFESFEKKCTISKCAFNEI